MGYWNSRGLRGSGLEDIINLSNEQYRRQGIALIQKIPTPIVPVEIDGESRNIKKAYFDQKSTVDYIGVMGGIPLCFDAKETGKPYLPFSNIHPHQVEFMRDFNRQGGLAFLLVHFTLYQEYFLLPFEVLEACYESGDRRSVPREAFEERYRIPEPEGCFHYLTAALTYYRSKKAEE